MTNPTSERSTENESKQEFSVEDENYFVIFHPLRNEISIFTIILSLENKIDMKLRERNDHNNCELDFSGCNILQLIIIL